MNWIKSFASVHYVVNNMKLQAPLRRTILISLANLLRSKLSACIKTVGTPQNDLTIIYKPAETPWKPHDANFILQCLIEFVVLVGGIKSYRKIEHQFQRKYYKRLLKFTTTYQLSHLRVDQPCFKSADGLYRLAES